MKFLLFLALAVCGMSASAHAAGVRIASWNIANLASGPDKALRGFSRPAIDYETIKNHIHLLGADIIALQEIGSMPGAKRVLGEGWTIAFETRCQQNAKQCNDDNDDIYTAIAYRDGLAGNPSVFQVDELSINHTDECGSTRPIRGGVGVKLDINGQTTWILSVHLKATCKDNSVEPGTQDDCVTQKKQFEVLKQWIDTRPASDAVIVAGDFNRRLLTSSDNIRRDILSSYGTKLKILPDEKTRSCWGTHRFDFPALQAEAKRNNPAFDAQGVTPRIYSPTSNFGIDHFVLINSGAQRLIADQIETDGYYRFEKPGETLKTCTGEMLVQGNRALTFGQSYPSDHCPMLLSVE
ncbi:endonuclease/exonuclease/phosphatase family protein [Bradyrhizobium yuanmingense]|uniref:endonuclease/exonuclease/phosphatase family protein n=1 Tax=Bradyrhizobium yuanmingense TaxID=108015 RepID=UPI0023B8E956|nr:endonuclease/exonuclease/phosphatase family protein [Bradyrhizobium yuanmingense]MDF0522850.1 endonuclease/exonuclease/phosphatase family protein [Bradyrhizobium yuanmingense]